MNFALSRKNLLFVFLLVAIVAFTFFIRNSKPVSAVSTDKDSYKTGETVKILFKNTGFINTYLIDYEVQKFADGEWISINKDECGCNLIMCVKTSPPKITFLKTLEIDWNQNEVVCGAPTPEKQDGFVKLNLPKPIHKKADPGVYRIKASFSKERGGSLIYVAYSKEFQIE